MNFHGRIMNIERDTMKVATAPLDAAYCYGHRDARHAAAEIALEADAELARLRAENEALRRSCDDWEAEMKIYRETDGVDAERYRHIRCGPDVGPHIVDDLWRMIVGDAADAEIDAARGVK